MVNIDKLVLKSEHSAILSSAIVTETDLAGKITYINNNFTKVIGFSKREIIGKTHRVINSEYHTKEFFSDLWRTISRGKIWRGIVCDITKNGEYVWLDSLIFPVLNKKHKPVKYISIRFDITPYYKN